MRPSPDNQYHCFWVNPYGVVCKQASYGLDEFAKVLDLVKQDHIEDSEVRNLTVIYGEKLEFEPARVVETWKVKE